MCTAIALRGKERFYFGRNMDIYYPLDFETARIGGEKGFSFSCGKRMERCFSVIGTAVVRDGYPLYADGMNEKGLCMAGLEFPESAYYSDVLSEEKYNVSPYELISWVLTQCATVHDARALLERTNIVGRPFSAELPLTPLHWMIADRNGSLVLESTRDGIHLYECTSNVLANEPPYPFHTVNLRQYAKLSAHQPNLDGSLSSFGAPFSSGFGAIGLPGDLSSVSRFVKASFVTANAASVIDDSVDGVSELLRALFSVAVPRGSVKVPDGRSNVTAYTCCMDVETGEYYRIPYEITEVLKGGVNEKI